MWFEESVFYQIYPLPVRAPRENDGRNGAAYLKLLDWCPISKSWGGRGVFRPVFESDAHGYDTRDYTKLDGRLGTNADFARVRGAAQRASGWCWTVCSTMWGAAFGPSGTYWRSGRPARTDWFHIDFGGNLGYNDGLWYEG